MPRRSSSRNANIKNFFDEGGEWDIARSMKSKITGKAKPRSFRSFFDEGGDWDVGVNK